MQVEKERILVIDDEEVIRDSISRAFIKEGFSVRSAADGESGCRLFREFRPDVVLVDLKMPNKSGLEVLAEIEGEDPDVIKIVITGYATISLAVDAMKVGAYDFLPKPFAPQELRRIVGRGIEKRRLMLESKRLRREQENIRRNMVSLVSHELRAPLAATVQYLEVLLGGFAGEISEESRDLISRCDVRLREMIELIGKWLSLATFDPDGIAKQFRDIDLLEVAREAVEGSGPLADEKGVRLLLDSTADLSAVKGDRISLAEVLNNLISNAVKYNRAGGFAKVKLYEQGEEVRLEVSDNGMGIAPEHLSRVFDEFYRIDGRRNAAVRGSGLGLAIVKKLVEAHGGRLQMDSLPGEGTTVQITFRKVFRNQKDHAN